MRVTLTILSLTPYADDDDGSNNNNDKKFKEK